MIAKFNFPKAIPLGAPSPIHSRRKLVCSMVQTSPWFPSWHSKGCSLYPCKHVFFTCLQKNCTDFEVCKPIRVGADQSRNSKLEITVVLDGSQFLQLIYEDGSQSGGSNLHRARSRERVFADGKKEQHRYCTRNTMFFCILYRPDGSLAKTKTLSPTLSPTSIQRSFGFAMSVK